jgi:hypothetical protein
MSLGFSKSVVSLPVALSGHVAFTFGKRLVVLGGYNATASADNRSVYAAVLNEGGSLAPFSVVGQLPAFFQGPQNAALAQENDPRGMIYLAGGKTSAGVPSNVVAVAQPNSSGLLTWKQGPSLPQGFTAASLAFVNGVLYCVGGLPVPVPVGAIAAVTGTIALAIVSGNAVTLTLGGGATWASQPVVGSYVLVDDGTYLATSVLVTAHAANAGFYRVTAATATVLHATKVANITGSTPDVTTPVATSATNIASVDDLENTATTGSAGVVLAAKQGGDGSLGSWTQALGGLSIAGVDVNAAAVTTGTDLFWADGVALGIGDKLYVAGGTVLPVSGSGATQAANSSIQVGTPKNANGNSINWSLNLGHLLAARANACTPCKSPGRALVIGGLTEAATASTVVATVDQLSLNSNGDLAVTKAQSKLNTAVYNAAAAVSGGYLYVLGGKNSSGTAVSTVQIAQFQSNGTV